MDSLKEHADDFNKLDARHDKKQLLVREQEKKLHDLVQKNDIVQDNLDVFLTEDGVLKWIVNNKMLIAEEDHEIKELKNELSLSQLGKFIGSPELDKLNDSLVIPLSESEVIAKIEDIKRHPSEYWSLFEKQLPEDPDKMARSLKLAPTSSTVDNASPHNIAPTSSTVDNALPDHNMPGPAENQN